MTTKINLHADTRRYAQLAPHTKIDAAHIPAALRSFNQCDYDGLKKINFDAQDNQTADDETETSPLLVLLIVAGIVLAALAIVAVLL